MHNRIHYYLATLLFASLVLAGCVTPPTGSAPLPNREPGRTVRFSFDGKDTKGAPLTHVVTLTINGIAANGELLHEEKGAWVPGPDVRPGRSLPLQVVVGIDNLIVTASATVEMLGNPGDEVSCIARDETSSQVLSRNTASVPRNAVSGGLFPLLVTCPA